MQQITEKERTLPVAASCGVLVAGGGIAGISAALAAARAGADVLLVERECLLGGLATLGLVTIYLPLCDGMGHQVSFGIAEELLRLSIQYGAEARYPSAWLDRENCEERKEQRFQVQYNPHLFALEVEALLLREGVTILYHTHISDVAVTDGKITHVIIENKSGRSAVAVQTVVDATGDADICHMAGEQTAAFEQGNVLAAWYYYQAGGASNLKMLGFADVPDAHKTGDSPKPLMERRFGGLDAFDNSEMLCFSHAQIRRDILEARKKTHDYQPITLPAIPQLRMTRRLDGAYTMDDTEIEKPFADCIGKIGDWRKRGPVYHLPFRILHGGRVKNLLAAGRCVSVTDAMWDITRVIPACAVTGQAAGLAAALAQDVTKLDINQLCSLLRRQNAVF